MTLLAAHAVLNTRMPWDRRLRRALSRNGFVDAEGKTRDLIRSFAVVVHRSNLSLILLPISSRLQENETSLLCRIPIFAVLLTLFHKREDQIPTKVQLTFTIFTVHDVGKGISGEQGESFRQVDKFVL